MMSEEFHDVHDVNVAIANKLIHSFAQIPAHLQSDEVAEEWFVSMITARKKPLEACLSEVPTEFWTSKFLTTVLKTGCNILGLIDPRKNALFQSVAFTCVRNNYKTLAALDPKYRAEFAEHLAYNSLRHIHLIAREFPWIRDHLPDEAVKRCCLNIDFAMEYGVLPDGIGRRIMINGDGYDKIRAHGRLELLAEQIVAGEWPMRLTDSDFSGPKPKSLEDGIHWLSQCSRLKDREALYMAYLLAQPMDQVVPLMCECKLHKHVLEMYSEEALAPYVKKYRALRGVMLEEALGL